MNLPYCGYSVEHPHIDDDILGFVLVEVEVAKHGHSSLPPATNVVENNYFAADVVRIDVRPPGFPG